MCIRDSAHTDRLIWIDLEMTGLDTGQDSIIEIATVVTDSELNVLAEGPEFAIAHPVLVLEAMDDWNRGQHSRSGLWKRVLESEVTLGQAEARTIAFLNEWLPANTSPMCGNSICQDRRFLHRLMPVSYTHLDVYKRQVGRAVAAPAYAARALSGRQLGAGGG